NTDVIAHRLARPRRCSASTAGFRPTARNIATTTMMITLSELTTIWAIAMAVSTPSPPVSPNRNGPRTSGFPGIPETGTAIGTAASPAGAGAGGPGSAVSTVRAAASPAGPGSAVSAVRPAASPVSARGGAGVVRPAPAGSASVVTGSPARGEDAQRERA